MADSTILPGARAAIVVANGLPSPEIYRFFQAVAKAAGLTGDLQTQVTQITQVIEGMQGNQGRLMAGEGIEVQGTIAQGLAIVSLEALDDEGGGILLKITRDGYGRVAGTSSATTTDLAEGSNLYFTNTRVASALAQGTGVTLTVDPITHVTTISASGGSSTNLATIWASQ